MSVSDDDADAIFMMQLERIHQEHEARQREWTAFLAERDQLRTELSNCHKAHCETILEVDQLRAALGEAIVLLRGMQTQFRAWTAPEALEQMESFRKLVR